MGHRSGLVFSQCQTGRFERNTMLHTLAFFILGASAGALIMYGFAQRIANEKNRELRQWRKDALTAQHNADFWQNQYAKGQTK